MFTCGRDTQAVVVAIASVFRHTGAVRFRFYDRKYILYGRHFFLLNYELRIRRKLLKRKKSFHVEESHFQFGNDRSLFEASVSTTF